MWVAPATHHGLDPVTQDPLALSVRKSGEWLDPVFDCVKLLLETQQMPLKEANWVFCENFEWLLRSKRNKTLPHTPFTGVGTQITVTAVHLGSPLTLQESTIPLGSCILVPHPRGSVMKSHL